MYMLLSLLIEILPFAKGYGKGSNKPVRGILRTEYWNASIQFFLFQITQCFFLMFLPRNRESISSIIINILENLLCLYTAQKSYWISWTNVSVAWASFQVENIFMTTTRCSQRRSLLSSDQNVTWNTDCILLFGMHHFLPIVLRCLYS